MVESWVVLLVYFMGLVIGGLGGWFFAMAWYGRKLQNARQQDEQRWNDQQTRAYYQYRQPSQWIN